MAHQAPVKPTLPQNDDAGQQAARKAQIAASQAEYQWTDAVPALEGVPVVKTLPKAEDPTLEWWLKLVRIVLELAKNQVEVEADLIEQKLSSLDPALLAADRLVIGAIEKDVVGLELKLAINPLGKHSLVEEAKEAVELVSAEVAIADLKNHATKLQGIIEMRGATKEALGKQDRSLENYRGLFKSIACPEIAYTFQDDLEFANLRVAGPNSVLIEAVDAVPARCAVTAEQYAAVVPGDTLEAAVAQGRLFQCDFDDLKIIEPGEWEGVDKYLTCPVALFAVPPGASSLVPVAINCDPSDPASPVMTPSLSDEKQWGWEMAKLVVQVADGNYHELFAHLARTHLVIEAIAVATHRHLSDQHPVWALLVRHYEGTMFINEAAATSLITKGGPIDHIFAGTIASSQQAAVEARLTFDFTDGMLPNDLARRGVDANSALANYPYRDDGLLVWSAIESWVRDYLAVYYDADSDVTGDTELSAWAAAIAGHGQLKGFTAPQTIEDLVQICTMTIFTGSAQHASVNFPQKAIMEFAPAVTGALWQQAPDTQDGATKSEWIEMMPPQALALEQLKVLFLLGSLYYRPLGTYLSPNFPYPQWFRDERIVGEGGPLDRFQQSLEEVEAQIVQRNAERRRPYTFLLPSLIPSSTNI
ncbi:lipoxygenase family protein [Erythrobacter sp. HKB08]|uniref:lipoxygenase family protein n=1 Tax=Erythrobacter sp. HKB08 TaxID=2502843 RepID=UPI0010087F4F|nr:lipoxygenase family protein [Erythrobacter sp. HKB08]